MSCETGGIRFGRSFWVSSNLTFPFARIAITPGSIVIHSGIGSFFKREFRFKKTDISEISKKRGLFSTGLQIKHTVENLPGQSVPHVPGSYRRHHFRATTSVIGSSGTEPADRSAGQVPLLPLGAFLSHLLPVISDGGRWLRNRNALIPLLGLFLISCNEVRKSDSPVSREEALKLADVRLPLPSSASDVQFQLSGGTQNWDLFVSFSAPEADTQAMIKAELETDKKSGAIQQADYSGIVFEKKPITRATIPDSVGFFPPRWWHPVEIKKGYFVGPSHGGRAPRFWVDMEANRTFFFQHY